MTVTVRNHGKGVARLRITPPKTSHFTLNYVPVGSLAPGIALSADVEFSVSSEELAAGSPPLGEFLDSIVVTNGADRFEVPLRAQLPCPKVEFDRTLDMGLVVANTTVDKPLRVSNLGSRPAKWSLVFEAGTPLVASPASGTLAPRAAALAASGGLPRPPPRDEDDEEEDDVSRSSSEPADVADYQGASEIDVTVSMTAGSTGPFRAVGQLLVEGAVTMLLDVSATVVGQKLSLVFKNSKALLKVADFGNTLYGEEAVIEALLVNDGPTPVPYLVSSVLDRQTMDSMTRQICEDMGIEPPEPPPPQARPWHRCPRTLTQRARTCSKR